MYRRANSDRKQEFMAWNIARVDLFFLQVAREHTFFCFQARAQVLFFIGGSMTSRCRGNVRTSSQREEHDPPRKKRSTGDRKQKKCVSGPRATHIRAQTTHSELTRTNRKVSCARSLHCAQGTFLSCSLAGFHTKKRKLSLARQRATKK